MSIKDAISNMIQGNISTAKDQIDSVLKIKAINALDEKKESIAKTIFITVNKE